MCGILGYVSFSKSLCTAENFQRGLDQLAKRGPDAQGVFKNAEVFLGHRRLSIIDTSEGANQPISDHSGRYVLIFNGEIFNFQQLKNSHLVGLGISFRTQSDSEVLLYLLIHFGVDCLSWLSGFFAFAFYDTESQQLLVGRDRFGKKPLIIYKDQNRLIFGSEMKALLPLLPKRIINPSAVFQYFRLNYIPPDQSILKDVQKVRPGSCLLYSRQGLKETTYYQTTPQPQSYGQRSYQEAQSQLLGLMRESVRERMISDVPIGAFLSGGIDSSVVVALASEYTSKLKTFSIGYKDNPLFDESEYAQLVADKYQTDHEVFYLSESDYKDEVMDILAYLDEPFADSSCIPQYILCKKTKRKVTVALSGDGGDEVFAGYNKHHAEWMVRNRPVIAAWARIGKPLWTRLPQNKNTSWGNLTRKLAKLAEGAVLNASERYIRWCSILNTLDTQRLFSSEFLNQFSKEESVSHLNSFASPIGSNDFNEVLLSDLRLVLPGDMLQKVDLMSMANSLEVRSPFLDYRVVDFAFQLPSDYKIDRKMKKKIVQDAFRSLLPEALYNRPKQGFEIPLLEWFRNDFHAYIFDDLLARPSIESQGIFSFETIQALKQKLHSANPGYVQSTIWALVVFQHWYKKYSL